MIQFIYLWGYPLHISAIRKWLINRRCECDTGKHNSKSPCLPRPGFCCVISLVENIVSSNYRPLGHRGRLFPPYIFLSVASSSQRGILWTTGRKITTRRLYLKLPLRVNHGVLLERRSQGAAANKPGNWKTVEKRQTRRKEGIKTTFIR